MNFLRYWKIRYLHVAPDQFTLTRLKPWGTLKRLKEVELREGVDVSAGVAVLANFGRDEWNAEVFGSLSVASQLALLVKDRGRAIRLAFTLRKLDSGIEKFLEDVYMIIEGRKKAPPSEEELTPERARLSIHALIELSITMSNIFDQAKRKRLTNNSLLAGPLYRMHAHADELLDIADWLDTIISQENVEPLFARAEQEKARGEVHRLDQAD